MEKRILLMYISLNSGHQQASLNLEKALRQLSPEVSLSSVNALRYTHPILERFVRKTYFNLIRYCPWAWDYLYDRPGVFKRTQRLRSYLYHSNFEKLRTLLEEFKPDVAVCTQAFPCGLIAAYKRICGVTLPLVGVLTDYEAHAYWIDERVDTYVVPSDRAREYLCTHGIPEERIRMYGIPIDPRFCLPGNRDRIFQKLGLSPDVPTLLVMGGSHGFGPIAELVRQLDRLELPVQLVVVCGKNEKLLQGLSRSAIRLQKGIRIFGFIDHIDELMEVATCLISKPGGITTAEALAKGLPMIILNPIGGQETANAEFLLREKIALKAGDPREAVALVRELLAHPARLKAMRRSAEKHKRPTSALESARMLLSFS